MLRLLRTTSFRFTIIYVLLFSGAVAILGAYVYQSTFGVAAKQTDDILEGEITVLTELFAVSGPGMLRQVIRQRTAWRDDGIYMLIGAPSGVVLTGNLTALPPETLQAEDEFFNFNYERALLDAAGREIGVETRDARGRIARLKSSPEATTWFVLLVARDVAGRENLRKRSQSVIFRTAMATIALGLVIGLLFSRSLLRRVEEVNKTVRAIRGGDLTQRIALSGGGDELDHLATNLNSMLDQIERLMTGMREVSDNIAHDLRSPLTRIQNRLTVALDEDADTKEQALRATLKDAERMLTTFNALLTIARIESGEGAGAMEPVDLVAIAQEMAELYEPAAQDAGFTLALLVEPTPPIIGSRALISQAIANLLDNALKYAVGGSRVELKVGRAAAGGSILSVADDGPGVPEEDRGRILQRFVRLEESRSTTGSGLGLSLVAAIARAHDADLSFDGGLDGGGDSGFRIILRFPSRDRD